MSLYALWLVAGIVSFMIVLFAINRSMSKKKIAINNQPLSTSKIADVVSIKDNASVVLKKTA